MRTALIVLVAVVLTVALTVWGPVLLGRIDRVSLIIAFTAFLLLMVFLARTLRDKEWRRAARSLGLRYRSGRIHGEIEGYSVSVERIATGGGEAGQCHTKFRVGFQKPLGIGLWITNRGILTGLGVALGAQDIVVADREFDKAALVKGRDPARVVAYLTPARRKRILLALSTNFRLLIDDVGVTVEVRGSAWTVSIVHRVREDLALARCLAEDQS